MESRIKLNRLTLNAGIVLFLMCGASARSSNIYVSNAGDGTIVELGSNGRELVFASGLVHPAGFALDGSGNLYVADSGNGTILRFNADGNSSVFASGLNNPTGITFGKDGNLYVANSGTEQILQLNPGWQESAFASGLSHPAYLMFGNEENLCVSTTRSIEEFNSSGSQFTIFSMLNYEYGIASDNGAIYMQALRMRAVSDVFLEIAAQSLHLFIHLT